MSFFFLNVNMLSEISVYVCLCFDMLNEPLLVQKRNSGNPP